MRRLLRPLLIPVLRRDPDEVEKQARLFSVSSQEGRDAIAGVGRAFLGGYHTMLQARRLGEVSDAGRSVDPHHRPFFFEGAAMGYLPRAYFSSDAGADRVEADLLAIDPRFLYLYYVGLGFWTGFRHPNRPDALETLAPHLDPFHFPLGYDGFGFKLGFFDAPKRPAARAILDRAPAHRRAEIYQGYGRALFFVCMEDEPRFQREKDRAPAERRNDMEAGRSLALAFNGIKRPESIVVHLADAREDELPSRLLGVTWALTARELNDPEYFARCTALLPAASRDLFRSFTRQCREAKELSTSYQEWRSRTQDSIASAYAASGEGSRR